MNKNDQDKFSNDLLNFKYKLPKVSDDYLRYYAFNRCGIQPHSHKKINETIKIYNKPYIPGSSIKGAISTALLYYSLSEAEIEKIFINDKINFKLTNKYFFSSKMKLENIMKFLRVSDTNTSTRPYIYDIKLITALNDGNFIEDSNIQYYETIVDSKLFSKLTTSFDSDFYEELNLNDKEYLLEIDYIKKALYEFSKDYIDYEIEFAESYGIDKLKKFYKNYLKKENTKEKPLIRLGSNTGILSSTINLKIKQHTSVNNFNKVKEKINGDKARFDFPVSRKILNKTKYPLGWVKLSFKEVV